MKITSAEFIKSAFEKRHWTVDGRREIAFLGRSNVGKSSLINSLLLRKGLARTSNTPGRTQSINFFLINESFYFTDLPGYGYAKVSKSMRNDWGKMAEEYLGEREELALCIQLVDSRHKPSALDIQLNEWLEFNNKPHLIVATKSDKISGNELSRSLTEAAKVLPGAKILSYSAQTGRGRDQVWAEINAAINNYQTTG
ncbi:MAG: ribosome biogenesis GTP-binding protein YihA/YsxC [Pyrinomonadaceae bacterium]